jgi:hypothetical protein
MTLCGTVQALSYSAAAERQVTLGNHGDYGAGWLYYSGSCSAAVQPSRVLLALCCSKCTIHRAAAHPEQLREMGLWLQLVTTLVSTF